MQFLIFLHMDFREDFVSFTDRFKRDSCKSSIVSLSSISFCSTVFSITINSDAMLSINILLCPFKISAGITCMSFVRNPCFPDVAFNSRDLIFKISFG